MGYHLILKELPKTKIIPVKELQEQVQRPQELSPGFTGEMPSTDDFVDTDELLAMCVEDEQTDEQLLSKFINLNQDDDEKDHADEGDATESKT